MQACFQANSGTELSTPMLFPLANRHNHVYDYHADRSYLQTFEHVYFQNACSPVSQANTMTELSIPKVLSISTFTFSVFVWHIKIL